MLTYTFDNRHGMSMYEHLYRCIKNDITSGKLFASEKLPSKRTLAKNLGISLITVENAYAQLLLEGYIFSRPKIGYFVAPLIKQPYPSILPEVTDKQPKEESFFASFSQSSVPEETFPYNIWARLLRHTLTTANEHDLLSDTSAGGVLALRQAIAGYLYEFRVVNVDPSQIIIGAGTQILYNLIVQLLGRDKVYALEDPGYPRLAQIYLANSVSCRWLPMDPAGISMDSLKKSQADILHITPSHQFPTGIVMPISRRQEILRWALEKADRYIIEDDYDCEFRLSGRPIPPLQGIDTAEKVLYINTFSQTLAPTFRISYMVLPRHLTQLFYQKLGFYSCTVSNFEQFTLAKFIMEGHLERHINRMRTHYRNKCDLILSYIAKSFLASYFKIAGENSGLHFLLHFKTYASDKELSLAAKRKNIDVRFLSQYYHKKPSDNSHVLLINYAGIPAEKLLAAFDLLFEALTPYAEN
ncbi:MAG: PLP-dependent aminotransferase family protein [Phascolarctobacterium sp.]|nr:PLP-dependent aminotransferase family protein [Phascolarctobacterium sp.]